MCLQEDHTGTILFPCGELRRGETDHAVISFCGCSQYPCCCLGRSQIRTDPDLLPYSWFHDLIPPPPEPLPEPPRNLWERMQNIFDVNCTFEEYVTADDHAESSQPMTDEDTISAVHDHDSPSADSESSTPEEPDLTSDDDLDAESNDDGVAANESEIIHTSNQFLHILDQMKAYALHNQLSREVHTNIDNLSSILVQSKV